MKIAAAVLIIVAALLIGPNAGAAPRCASLLAQRNSPAKTSADNLIFVGSDKDVDRDQFEKFKADPKIDGSVPFPANLTITLRDVDEGFSYTTKFTVGSISAQPKALRNLLRNLKVRGKSHFVDGEVEFGAIIMEYEDGRTRVVRFTSDLADAIEGTHFSSAVTESGALTEHTVLKKLIFIHTHPRYGEDKSTITPSVPDYLSLQEVESKVLWGKGGPNIQGIVLPSTPATSDSFFLFGPRGIGR